jgi:hypothetical protein
MLYVIAILLLIDQRSTAGDANVESLLENLERRNSGAVPTEKSGTTWG